MTSPVGGTLAQTAVEIIADTERFEPEAKRRISRAIDGAGREAQKSLSKHFDRMADDAGDSGDKIGRNLGDHISRSAESRLRDNRGRFVKAGADVGDAVARGADGRLRDSKGRFVTAGSSAGGGFGEGFESALGGKFATALRQRLTAAASALPEIKIGADSSDADKALDALRTRLLTLADKRIGIDIGAGEALAEVTVLQAQLNRLGASTPDIGVKVDTAFAEAQLAQLTAAALAASRDVTINADADTGAAMAQLAALRAASGGASSGMVGLALAGAALAPAIVPAAAAAAAAIAALGTAAGVGLAGVGVLALGFVGVGEAVGALSEAQETSAKSGTKLLGQQIAIANALDGVRSAEASLANVRTNAADGAIRAAERVRAAQGGVTRAQREAADGVAQAVRRQQDAERALASVQDSVRRAQVSLTDARRDAARALEDLKSQTRSGALSEQQALLSLARARADLQTVGRDRSASALDRAQAALDVKFAEERLNDQRTANQRLSQDKADADRRGVDGSLQVVAATEQVRDAILRVADAQRSVGDAGKALDDARIAGAERVADAQRNLTEAVRAQAAEARQSAFSIAQAQQGVIQAQRSLEQATSQAAAGGSESMEKLRKAMDDLSPAGKRFALFLFGLKPLLDQLRASAQEGLLPGVEAGMRVLLPFFPQINAFVGMLAKLMGDLFLAGAKALTSPFWLEFFGFMARIAGPTLQTMFEIVMNVAQGFAGLLKAFFPVSKDMGDGLLGLSKRFADFGASAEKNPGFRKFLDYIRENGPKVVAFLSSLFGAIGNVVKALAPFAGPVLDGVTAVFNFIRDMPTGELQILIGIIGGVTAAVWLLNLALAANPITLIGIAIAAVGVALVMAYNRFTGFREVVDAVFQAVAAAALWLWHSVLEPAFTAWWGFAQTMASAYMWLWKNVLQPVFEGIGAVISFWWKNIVTPVFNAVVFVVSKILAPLFMWLWRNVITPAFDGIKFAISLAWASIRVVFGLIQIALKILAGPFLFLWRNVVRPAFEGIASAISFAWNKGIKPILSALGGFIERNVAPAFARGVTAIKSAWDKVVDIAKKPVRLVVNQVLNGGILNAYNRVAKLFKVKPDNVRVDLPKGFASGGIYQPHRYTPGKDIGFAAVGGYESIMRPEWTRAMGAGYVHAANRAARTGGVEGVRRFMGNYRGAYADGGIIGLLKGPAGFVKGLMSNGLGKLRQFADNDFGRLVTGVVRKLSDGLVSNVKKLFSFDSLAGALGNDGPNQSGGPSGSSYQAIISVMRKSGIPFTVSSTYRPGANDFHGRGMAVDSYASAANMARMAKWMYQSSSYWKELIHSGGGGYFVKDGKRVGAGFYRSVLAGHYNHVHSAASNAAMAKLSQLVPKLGNGGVFSKPLLAQVAESGREVVVPLTRPRRAVQLARESGLVDLLAREGAFGRNGGPHTTVHAPITVESRAADPETVAVRTVAALVRTLG